jgi:hypothetical protein
MKKLLILSLLVLCVGCSQKTTSKTIDLVCEGNYSDNTKKNFTLHIDKDKSTTVLRGSEYSLKCDFSKTTIICSDLNSITRIDRYSLIYNNSCCDNVKEDLSSNGQCRVVDKQI